MLIITVMSLLVVGAVLPRPMNAGFQADVLPQETEADPLRGGRLYAAWDQLLGSPSPPLEQQPLWPTGSGGSVPPLLTWRCVNCHGWDYAGSSGSSLTGVYRTLDYPSLFGVTADEPEEIFPILNGVNNPDHDFIPPLAAQDLRDLAAFLSSSLVQPGLIADPNTAIASGTAVVGEIAYAEYCLSCHGAEGEKINLGTVNSPIFLGDLGWSNPWRIAHITRFGHVATRVPPASVFDLSFSQQIDIVTYIQTMPSATDIAEKVLVEFDPDSQADLRPMTYGAIAISLLIFLAVFFTLRRQK